MIGMPIENAAEKAEVFRIMENVRARGPGFVDEGTEALFVEAIEKLTGEGGELISGSFGFLGRADPMAAVARLHPLWKTSGGALFLGCELLGWNHDQAWAFIAGFDQWPKASGAEYVDPRAKAFPECVALGKKLREKYLPKASR